MVEMHEEADGVCCVLRPAFRANWPQTVRLLISLSLVSGGIAAAFGVAGFWPILPFAGLELGALWVALYVSAQRSLEVEVIRIAATTVDIEKGRRALESNWRFERVWSEVVLKPPRHPWYPSRLIIRSRGRMVELGRFLGEEERQDLARRLHSLLGPMATVGGAREARLIQ